jgi:phage/plasmid-like protein (TIGR03299 family)
MGHGIEERDGVFAVRQAMWHGLGTILSDYPTREDAQKLAHPWEPETEPLYRRRVSVEQDPRDGSLFEQEHYEKVETGVLNVRSDDMTELAVVSPTFVTVSNNEMYDIAEVIEGNDPGAVQYETGGTLFGGKKVWLMIRLTEPIVITGDPRGETIPYFAIQNSHDGSGAFRGQAILDRIVCANTAQAADLMSESMGTEFKFSHTKNVQGRIDEAKKALAGWRASVARYKELSEEMVKETITVHQREIFVEDFIPMPMTHTASDRVMDNVQTARQTLRKILAGPTCEDIGLTTYGLVQASIEYVNHYRKAQSNETRFKRAYLDRNKIVTDAITLARDVVNA